MNDFKPISKIEIFLFQWNKQINISSFLVADMLAWQLCWYCSNASMAATPAWQLRQHGSYASMAATPVWQQKQQWQQWKCCTCIACILYVRGNYSSLNLGHKSAESIQGRKLGNTVTKNPPRSIPMAIPEIDFLIWNMSELRWVCYK